MRWPTCSNRGWTAAPGSNADLTAAIRKIYEDLVAKQTTPTGYVFRPEQIEMRLMEVRQQLPPTEGDR